MPRGSKMAMTIDMRGFSLLEVMAAITILAGLLIAVTRIVSHSYYYTERVAAIYLGTELARLKMHDVEEMIKKDGIPTADKEEEGEFEEKAYQGFKWRYAIKRVHIPLPDVGGSLATGEAGETDQGQAADLLSGAKSMIEDFIKEKVRKLTVEVWWGEGKRESERVTFVLFIPADQGMQEFRQGGGAIQPGGRQRPGGPQKWFNKPPEGTPGAPSPAARPLPGGGPGFLQLPGGGAR